jgi:hypothetical protein
MSFIQFNKSFSDVSETRPVPAGKYTLRATSMEGSEKDGKQSLRIMHEIEGHPEAATVSHFLNLPGSQDDAGKIDFKMLLIKRYLTTFNVPHEDNGFNPDDIIGASATVELSMSEPRGQNLDVYNQINLPKLADEQPVQGATKKSAGAKR